MSFSPSLVRRRMCLVCIPVRWATLLLSLVAAAVAALLAVDSCIRLVEDEGTLWIRVVQAIVWGCFVMLCLYGWAGCILQRSMWVHWFYDIAWWHLLVNTLFAIYSLTVLNMPVTRGVSTALWGARSNILFLGPNMMPSLPYSLSLSASGADSPTSDDLEELAANCSEAITSSLLVFDFAVILALLLQFYLVVVIEHYLDELVDRDAAERFGVDVEDPNPPYRFDSREADKGQQRR